MEIERKFLVKQLPANYTSFPCSHMEQAYLCTDPVVRIRKEDENYYMTYKSRGLMTREEYNLPLSREAYQHLLKKKDGITITKTRYRIPVSGTALTIELDIFSGHHEGLILAEVEFDSEASALSFQPPSWFGEDVTFSGEYQNSRLSKKSTSDI